jgi:hypothetical protein
VTEPDNLAGDDRDEVDDTVFEQLDDEDTLADPDVPDPLDEGISPNEQPRGVDTWGVTDEEELEGEPLEGRLRREVPDDDDEDDGDGLGDTSDTDGELYDAEVGDDRAGRLVAQDGGEDFWADDVGVDGAGASAEEAAVHLVPDDE